MLMLQEHHIHVIWTKCLQYRLWKYWWGTNFHFVYDTFHFIFIYFSFEFHTIVFTDNSTNCGLIDENDNLFWDGNNTILVVAWIVVLFIPLKFWCAICRWDIWCTKDMMFNEAPAPVKGGYHSSILNQCHLHLGYILFLL